MAVSYKLENKDTSTVHSAWKKHSRNVTIYNLSLNLQFGLKMTTYITCHKYGNIIYHITCCQPSVKHQRRCSELVGRGVKIPALSVRIISVTLLLWHKIILIWNIQTCWRFFGNNTKVLASEIVFFNPLRKKSSRSVGMYWFRFILNLDPFIVYLC